MYPRSMSKYGAPYTPDHHPYVNALAPPPSTNEISTWGFNIFLDGSLRTFLLAGVLPLLAAAFSRVLLILLAIFDAFFTTNL